MEHKNIGSINCGAFAIRFEVQGGVVSATLTGEYFRNDEISEAVCAEYKGRQIGTTPVYLVPDTTVAFASDVYDRAESLCLSRCHDGPRGKPCGTCDQCRRAKHDLFTHILLEDVVCPERSLVNHACKDDLTVRISSAISSVIGSTKLNIDWNMPPTEKKIDEIFEKFGVIRNVKEIK